jgi:hypothetical protein
LILDSVRCSAAAALGLALCKLFRENEGKPGTELTSALHVSATDAAAFRKDVLVWSVTFRTFAVEIFGNSSRRLVRPCTRTRTLLA